MDDYTKEELEEALRSIESTISKCEKVLPKLKQGTSQHTLLIRRIKAFHIASSLINKALRERNNMELYKKFASVLITGICLMPMSVIP